MPQRTTRRDFLTILGILFFSAIAGAVCKGGNRKPSEESESLRPNIVFILTDDLGYGDVGCYNPESKIPTPNLDKLAGEGIRFTDAHSPATVCTPTRYSLMTGRMAFRTGKGSRVFEGTGGPSLIEESRLTLGGMLQYSGYTTAMYGKWHIGLTWKDSNGDRIRQGGMKGVLQIDYGKSIPIPDAPIHRGFDYFFGTPNCPTTDALYVYIDGDDVPVPATGLLDKSTLPDHPFAWDCDRGMVAPGYEFERTDLLFLDKALRFMQDHRDKSPDKPGETTNLYYKHPEIVRELKSLLEISKQSGRSAPLRRTTLSTRTRRRI